MTKCVLACQCGPSYSAHGVMSSVETSELGAVRDALFEVDWTLTSPGAPFDTATEDVLGVPMSVFRHRPASMREILAASSRYGDRDCFVFSDGTRVTFAELPGQVASVAAYLHEVHGVDKGDRVAICAANGPGWLLLFWASTAMGAVVVAMNGWWSALEMTNALELTDPTVVFADEDRGARLAHAYVDLDRALPDMLHQAPEASLPETTIAEDDPLALIFTSGTTGRPKAACLSHRSAVAFVMLQAYIGARRVALRGIEAPPAAPPTRLAVFPLFHVAGLGTTMTAVHDGATTVWPLGRFDAGAVIDLTRREGINVWGGTTTHVMRLLDHPDIGSIDPTGLVAVGIGGSATTPELVRRTEARFPHLAGSFSTGYGSTEVGGLVSWAPNAMLAMAPDCVGPVLPTIQVRITGPDATPLGDGQEGDIWVRSPLVMTGYWENDDANAEVFTPDRWFRTGDYGRLDAGVLYLASRRRDLIIRGGENIYPFEIENRLEEHTEVIEAAVVGVDDDVLGQEVKAVVVVREGSTLDEATIRSHCAETLASYKVPAHVDLRLTPLPRNPTGKIMKNILSGTDPGTFADLDALQ